MTGSLTALQYCRTEACSSGCAGWLMTAPSRATRRSRSTPARDVRSVPANPTPEALAGSVPTLPGSADDALPLHPCSPTPAPAPLLPSELSIRAWDRGAATRSSRACPPASRTAPASSATTGRSSLASARAPAIAARGSNQPAHLASALAPPGNAPDQAPPAGDHSSAHDVRHAPLVPDLHMSGQQPGLGPASRSQRNRVAVRPHFHAALAIHRRKTDLRQLEAFRGQRQQMLLLDVHGLANRLRFSADLALLVLLAGGAQILIQLSEVFDLRNRHQMVPPEVAGLAFHAALLVGLGGVAELRLKSPMRTERDEPLGLLPLMPTQNLPHCAFQVVIAEHPEDPAKVVKGSLVSFEKGLLRGVPIRRVERPAASHAAHGEKVHLLAALGEIHCGLIPIDLGFTAP